MNYGEKMKEIRSESNSLQKDIAKVLNISIYTYSHYETKDAIILIKHLINFCNYFKNSLDYILSLSNEKEYSNITKETNLKVAGQRLKTFRKEQKITQNRLAKELNTTPGVIANYERGRTLIATPFLYTICLKYNVSADYLIGRIDNPKS